MATWEEIEAAVTALPDTAEPTPRRWTAHGRGLVWERPLRRSDHEALGPDAWPGEIVCVRTPDLDAKDALLASAPEVWFTTPHFHGYPAVLARLERLDADEAAEVVTDGWLSLVPKRTARAWLDAHPEVAPG
ncbi:MmcQ/YjbR family DNA-binding protein [Cellulomonas sp. H30R-01]|uniref:MmcQ/YjbR family DNA-binding protein n=1 Tax=Cellulomonas sp. H30R-01 TaxID=2704467 RepID=UPI00138D31F3|nr:MmcQ/YjbR family DNA-binding protein [Cellulomonas sp. H30R-01]QHT55622.1 MmcQ/YjbR family DNA-binding protein [Cellulomonas sp. H30R-01]